MPEKDLLISVVVPVYNVEKYIHQCVDSILTQTYKNIEVILVDDGSPDNCPAICDEYAQKDNRVKVVHKQNGGSSSARETGINFCVGDYIMVVDSDDWVDINTIEHCVKIINNHNNLDCVIFSYIKERKNSSYEKHLFKGDKYFLSKDEFEDNIYCRLFGLTNERLTHPESLEYLTSCCMKLYRRDLLRDIMYVDTKQVGSGEDGIFCICALKDCKSAVYLDKPFYHYRANESSITSSYRPNLVSQWSFLFSIMQKFIYEYSLTECYQEALNNRITLGVLGIGLNGLCSENMSFIQFKNYINSYIKSELYRNAIKTMKLRCLPITWKVLMFFSKYKMSFFLCILLKVIKCLKSRM